MMSPRSFLVTRQNHVHAQASQTQPNRRDSSPTPLSVSTTSDTTTKTKDETLLGIATDSTPSASHTANTMPSIKRKDAERLSPSPSPPRTTSSITHIAGTTSPVQIPVKKSDASRPPQKLQRHPGERRSHHHGLTRPREAHNPEAVPPAVAALLAITNIPPQRSTRGSLRRGSPGDERRMTVNAIIERQQEVEKELSWNLSKSPMDLLLTPPEELDEDAFSMDDSVMGSLLSTRTISVESMPSLLDSSISGTISSTDSLQTPARGRRIQPTRRCLTPVSPPAGDILLDHPLSDSSLDVNELDFRVFEQSPSPSEKKHASKYALNPLKSAFKSNLTASLRALRNAARSFSNLNLTSIPPEDFLTRSILTLDPRIPYTDERRPPPLEDEPSEALRRYLNPTTARLEPLPASAPSPTTKVFTASIQMQTYRVQRARSAPPTSRTPVSAQADSSSSHTNPVAPNMSMPGPRQRELRENSDFIRIAVMEMAMRKKGKLDDRKPGRARLALPPRKTSGRPYEVGTDGVPVRWRSMSYP